MALDWLPIYPDQRPRRLVAGLFQWVSLTGGAFAGSVPPNPIPNDLPPTDWPLPAVYPDRTYRAARLPMYPFLAQWPMLPVADLRWEPRYPSILRRPKRYVGALQFTAQNLGAQQDIPKFASWRPTYQNRLHRAARIARGESRWVVDPTTLLKAASCVEWEDEATIRSQLTAEAATRPTMQTGVTGDSFLLNEDGSYLLLETGYKILLESQQLAPNEGLIRPVMDEEDVC